MGFYQFRRAQKIPANINRVWDFISAPSNLKRITPQTMGFEITSSNTSTEMYEGMIISYLVKAVFNIKTLWVTEITHIVPKTYFIDEQRIGPYKMWHHEHRLEEIRGGVLMTDIVSYQPPMGFLGKIANTLIIQNKLTNIFDFRTQALEKIFGKWNEQEL